MDTFLWWSGVIAWGLCGAFGILAAADGVIDWTVQSWWTKREFMAFVWDRLKAKRDRNQS